MTQRNIREILLDEDEKFCLIYKNFFLRPIDQDLINVPGIDKFIAIKMKDQGIQTAFNLLGIFLQLKRPNTKSDNPEIAFIRFGIEYLTENFDIEFDIANKIACACTEKLVTMMPTLYSER